MKIVLVLMSSVTLSMACGGTSKNGTEDEDHGGSAGQSSSSGGGGASAAGQASAGAGTTSQAGGGGAGRGGSGRGGRGSGGAASAGSGGIPPDIGSGACHDFTPCGGDLVGTWSFDACLDPPPDVSETLCPEGTSETKLTGTVTWRADGTMTAALQATVKSTLTASCVARLGVCGEPGGALAECVPAAAGGCACTFMSENETPSNSSYTTSPDGLLTVSNEGQPPEYSYFCRQGEEAWARAVGRDGAISVLQLTKL